MCRNIHKKYNWYTVVRDSTYVNTHALMGVLRKMSPSQPLIIGETPPTTGLYAFSVEMTRTSNLEAISIFI